MIDLSRMRRVDVDPERNTARAQGGATWGDFDTATAAHGLATTGGAISTTGIGGLTLGGGLGNLMRSYGLACDNLLSCDVVTANGDVVTASTAENPDLFWGLRGGGGNFGVVTTFEYRLHPVSQVLGGVLLFPIDRARDLIRLYRTVTEAAPDALGASFVMTHAPGGPPVCAVAVCYNGPTDEGEQVIKPFREFGPPLAGEVGPVPYTVVQTIFDAGFAPGLLNYWRSHFLTDLTNEGMDILIDQFSRVSSPLSAILIEDLGGAVARVSQDATAFNFRDHTYNLAILGRWADPSGADAGIAWTRGVHEAMQPFAAGVYVNYLSVGGAGGSGPRGLRRGEIRPPGRAQEPLRPDQPLLLQPEHRAVRLSSPPPATGRGRMGSLLRRAYRIQPGCSRPGDTGMSRSMHRPDQSEPKVALPNSTLPVPDS